MVAYLFLNVLLYLTGFSCPPDTVLICSQLLIHLALATTLEVGPIVILSLQTGKLWSTAPSGDQGLNPSAHTAGL